MRGNGSRKFNISGPRIRESRSDRAFCLSHSRQNFIVVVDICRGIWRAAQERGEMYGALSGLRLLPTLHHRASQIVWSGLKLDFRIRMWLQRMALALAGRAGVYYTSFPVLGIILGQPLLLFDIQRSGWVFTCTSQKLRGDHQPSIHNGSISSEPRYLGTRAAPVQRVAMRCNCRQNGGTKIPAYLVETGPLPAFPHRYEL